MNIISLFFLRRAPGPRRSPMRPMGLLSLSFLAAAAAGAGLQLDVRPQERLYTRADVARANRAEGGGACLCVSEADDVVRSVARQPPVPCAILCGEAPGRGGAEAGRIIRWRLGELWPPFVWDHRGPRNSSHLLDPFTVTHVSHGILYFAVWSKLHALFLCGGTRPVLPIDLWWQLGAAVGAVLEAAWEVGENAPATIVKFRAGGTSRDYYGDAAVNSLADWAAAMASYFTCVWYCTTGGCATNRVIRISFLFFLVSEAALVIYQHDCMVLILLQLFFNPPWLIDFQNRETIADWMMQR